MKKLTSLVLALAALAAAPLSARAAEPVVLRFAYPSPPQGAANVYGYTPWAKEIFEASGGTVEIKIFPGSTISDFNKLYDRVVNGVADMGFAIIGPVSSDFPKTMVSALPFEAQSVEEVALAIWRVYERGLNADEYSRVKLLCLFTFADNGLHTRKPIRTMADMQGMKISVGTRQLGEIIEKLGGTPVPLQPSDLYSANQRGLVDGTATAWPALAPFKLQEVTSYHLDIALGQGPAHTIMNKEAYAKLPEVAQKAIDSHSGEVFTRRMAKLSQRTEIEGREAVAALPNQHINRLDPAEERRWAAQVAPVTEAWTRSTPNGAAVLAAYRTEVLKARAELAR
jgi:TRAP-type C4-dicarboxylate transport system substrate-binding protein